MRRVGAIVVLALWSPMAPGCASAPPRRVSPDADASSYVRPLPRPGELTPNDTRRFEEAWAWLGTGRWPEALKRLRALDRGRDARPSVAITRAYCILRSGRHDEARRLFDEVLSSNSSSSSALVGAALAATRRGLREDAIEYLRRATAESPEDGAIRRFYADTKIQLTEMWVGEARRASEQGDGETAVRYYEKTLSVAPEVAGVRLELAEALLARQDAALAASVLAADVTEDRVVQLRLGQVLQGLQEFPRALDVYRKLSERFPGDADARRGVDETLRSLELLALPEELRRLPSAPRATRADVAALLLLRVPTLAEAPPGEPEVAVDVSGSWAREHIVRALALRLLEVFPNHTFQPGAAVRRGELATALVRAMDLLGLSSTGGPLLADVPRATAQFDAASRVVGAGLMGVSEDGAFEPWRVVSGRELWDVVEALALRAQRRTGVPAAR